VSPPHRGDPVRRVAYVGAAMEKELAGLRSTGEGGRGRAAFRAAAAIGSLVAAGHVQEAAARELLLDAAAASGLPARESLSHVRRGLAAGMRTPRVIPDGSRSRVPPPPVELPPAEFPPGAEALWDRAGPVGGDEAAVAWLLGRSLDPVAVEDCDLLRVIPPNLRLPKWAFRRGVSWVASGHRILARVWDAAGRLASVRARSLRTGRGDDAKELAPTGYGTAGLVLADALGVQLLAGCAPDWWTARRVIVCEGVPDWVTWASRQRDSQEEGPAVFGIAAGSWTWSTAARIPDGAEVVIRVHHDEAGDRYAACIRDLVGKRCRIFRSREEGVP